MSTQKNWPTIAKNYFPERTKRSCSSHYYLHYPKKRKVEASNNKKEETAVADTWEKKINEEVKKELDKVATKKGPLGPYKYKLDDEVAAAKKKK